MKSKETPPLSPRKSRRRARSPEEREAQLISLAMDRVEERMMNGTASSQEYVHFLKAASTKERYETEKVALELELVKAKTENLKLQQKSEEMYAKALKAFKRYTGADDDEEDEEEDEDLF